MQVKNTEHIRKIGARMRSRLFDKLCDVKEGHPGSILSIFDIVTCIYHSGYCNISKENQNSDFFIMSKGHAAAAQYPFLVEKQIIPMKDWDLWGKSNKSCLRVFGNIGIPGIDVTSGSLGHGIGIGCGVAISDRMDQIKRNIFVIISEGELYEGSTWEALLLLSSLQLTAVKIVVDVNKNMILGRPEECLKLENIGTKLEAFNCEVERINGHDYSQIMQGLDFLSNADTQPRILIADTIKGKGVSFLEDRAESHYWMDFDEDQIKKMKMELSA